MPTLSTGEKILTWHWCEICMRWQRKRITSRYDTKAPYMKLPRSVMASTEAHGCTNGWIFIQHCWEDMLIEWRGQTSINHKHHRRCITCLRQNNLAAMATHMFGQDFEYETMWRLQIPLCACCQRTRMENRWFALINIFAHPTKRTNIKYITIKAIVFPLNAPLLQHGPLSDISRPLRLEFTARQRGLVPRQEGRAAGGPRDDVRTCLPLDGDVHE